jgi:hypothetical protein
VVAVIAVGTRLLGIAFCLIAWLMVAECAHSAEPVHIWVHIWGCPHPREDVILIFSDGQSVIIHVDKLPPDGKAKLKALVGSVQGYNVVYDCGTES